MSRRASSFRRLALALLCSRLFPRSRSSQRSGRPNYHRPALEWLDDRLTLSGGIGVIPVSVIDPSDGAPDDRFGGSVSISGDTVVGASNAQFGNEEMQGTAYVATATIHVNPIVQLPAGKGANVVVVSCKGNNVRVVNNRKQVLVDQPLDSISMVTITGAANGSDSVTVDLATPWASIPADGIVFDGGAGTKGDTLLVRGTAAADTITLCGGSVALNGLGIEFRDVEQLTVDGGKGDDSYHVSDVSTKTVISDSNGCDVYQVTTLSAGLTISDSSGIDLLDFSQSTATVGVTIDLGKSKGQAQEIFTPPNPNTLALQGTFDNVFGSPLADQIKGNAATNMIQGRDGDDRLDGSAGSDILVAGAGKNVLFGGPGDDLLFGGPADDSLDGDAGNDTLAGCGGNDTLAGGAGDDAYRFNAGLVLGNDAVTELPKGGTDTLDFSCTLTVGVSVDLSRTDPQSVVPGNLGLDLSASDVIENAIGGDGDDVLVGNALANRLEGGDAGDTLVGGAGNDVLTGGSGDDIYWFDPSQALGTDTVIELPGAGADTLDLSDTTVGVTVNLAKKGTQTVVAKKLSLILSAGNVMENAIGGSGDDVLIGNMLDNVLTGHSGSDILLGGAGADTLSGGPSSGDDRDVLLGGSGADMLRGGTGDDLLFGGVSVYHNEKTGLPDLAALSAIMAKWKSSHSYSERWGHLLDGGGLNKKCKLKGKLLSDAAADSLYGEGEQDWFIVHAEDFTPDLDTETEVGTLLKADSLL